MNEAMEGQESSRRGFILMRNLLASFIVMFCVVSFTVGPVAAKNGAQPNHPKLFNPKTDRFVAIGLPQGENRVWVDEVIPTEERDIVALCLKDLTSQRMFPGAGPAVRGSMFCLADIETVFYPFQLSATVIVRHARNPFTASPAIFRAKPHSFPSKGPSDRDIKKFSSKVLKKGSKGDALIPNCSILIENEPIISGGTISEEPSRQHVITCSSTAGPTSLYGAFRSGAIDGGQSEVPVDLELVLLNDVSGNCSCD